VLGADGVLVGPELVEDEPGAGRRVEVLLEELVREHDVQRTLTHAPTPGSPRKHLVPAAEAAQGSSRTTDSATQAGFSWPSISMTCLRVSCLPAGRSVTSPTETVERIREPTRTGFGKRTLLTP